MRQAECGQQGDQENLHRLSGRAGQRAGQQIPLTGENDT